MFINMTEAVVVGALSAVSLTTGLAIQQATIDAGKQMQAQIQQNADDYQRLYLGKMGFLK